MIIKKLVLHNFGIYASTNTFDFSVQKPIILIGGMNGRGKTTVLEAILLALYGMNSFSYKESKFTSYGQYLKSYVNNSDDTLRTFVEIEFLIKGAIEETYKVRREWNGLSLRPQEKVEVWKNGEKDVFLTENWTMFIENILPSALSSFFFFDGEKIASLAEEDTNEQMKNSIRSMLGITILDVLQGDLHKVVSKVSRENYNQDLIQLELLKNKRDEAKKNVEAIDENIRTENETLNQMSSSLEELNVAYTKNGGNILEKKNHLLIKRAELQSTISNCNDILLDITAGELPFALVADLLKDIETQGKIEQVRKIKKIAVEEVKSFYEHFGAKSIEIAKFIDFMKSETSNIIDDNLYNMSDNNLFQVEKIMKDGIKQCKSKAIELISNRNVNQKKIDDIDNFLAVDIDNEALESIFNKIKKTEQEIIKKKVHIDNLNKERTNLNFILFQIEAELSKFTEKTLGIIESKDRNERIVKYAHIAADIIKNYEIRLQKRKTDLLAETMTICYKKLANKKNLVSIVKIDSQTLDLKYFDDKNELIDKKRLSAGEKQLMVVALLWALAICSKKKPPVIIDTPLSRLDSQHRSALVTTYFPNASEQTIILSTDSEIDKNYYNLMKDSVGDTFTLKYNEKSKSTLIKRGYFNIAGEVA